MENKRTEKVDSTINGADREKKQHFSCFILQAKKKVSQSSDYIYFYVYVLHVFMLNSRKKATFWVSDCDAIFFYKSSSSSFSRSYKRLHIHTHAAHSWMYMDCKCNSLTKNEHTKVILYDYNRINISVKVTRIFFFSSFQFHNTFF